MQKPVLSYYYITESVPKQRSRDIFSAGIREENISKAKKASTVKTPPKAWSVATLAALVLLGLAGAFFLARAVDTGPFRLVAGALEFYAQASGGGAFVSLQRNRKDFWGFIDAPEQGIYGLVSGTKSGWGRLSGRGIAGKDTMGFSLSPGFAGIGKTLLLKPEGKPEIAIRLKNRPRPFSLSLKIHENKDSRQADAKREVEIAQIASAKKEYATLLDRLLRRRENPAAHAASLLGEFTRAEERLPPHSGPDTLMLRPYVLRATGRYLSLAQETYLFQGGAHGISVMVFDTIDMKTGGIVEAGDFFKGGWEAALPRLLAKEAARQLEGSALPGKKADADSLTGFGLFENALPLPSGIFPCASGFGFYYNRYEIAPGSMGDFLFVLPYREIEGLLRDEWKPGNQG